ncbi:MAG TPA: Gfo/Idh/MocA family oxidoreductase [Rhodothermales bacterium]
MRVAVLGAESDSAVRLEAVRGAAGSDTVVTVDVAPYANPAELSAALPPDTGVVFSGGIVCHYEILAELARRGIHLFLEWPPAFSVSECRNLAELAGEAGVQIGVSRPLRFHPWPTESDEASHLEVVTVRQARDVRAPGEWKRAMEDAVDLVSYFARGASPRRIDAAVARSEGRLALLTIAGIRFQNGSYSQIEVRHADDGEGSTNVVLGGSGRVVTCNLDDARLPGIRLETTAFLEAVRANRPPQVTVLDAAQTFRLMERLMERLRQ